MSNDQSEPSPEHLRGKDDPVIHNTAVRQDPTYVLGRSEAEAERLRLQAHLLDPITRRFLQDAGLATGMRVLDIGSGTGDVAFAAADLVGPTGSVVGGDANPAVLETARARAAAEDRHSVSFVTGDCRTAELPGLFDVAVGRFVLMYTSDVTQTVQAIAQRVRPGGILAFAEADFSSVLGYTQASAAHESRALWQWAEQAFARAGISTAMATPLHRAFLAAGLGVPVMALQARLAGAEDGDGFTWFEASLRSLLPVLEQHGLVSAETLDVDRIAQRCRTEVIQTGVPLMLIPLVTAWARKPLGV